MSASTLLAAFTKVKNEYAATTGFTDLRCHGGFATALQKLKTEGEAEPATFLFRYTRATKTWAVVTAGSSDICDGVEMPAETRRKFPICDSGS
ncbi:hypothetical protein GCM10009557_26970 [Virgisporangium ochraceum]|uniref:hypothetical protein n=1 Tax=Virgisporangium ochraceum TaxID=65505 RepID=UPI001942D67D|nr:hypothetical protein [Virgisporangium ochraceum]